MERILLHKPKMSGFEMDFIAAALSEDWAVPLGPDVSAFEEELKGFLNNPSKEVVAVNSGTAAMHLALLALGVKPGDEVLCQSFTFCASCNPAVYIGAKPVFVDSERESWNIDPQLLEEAIISRRNKTGRTPAAIISVALYGMPYKWREIKEVADKYKIPVIEDAAEGFGSSYNGNMLGTLGNYGVLSFNGNKMITASGGGAVVCPDKATKEKILWYATQTRENFPWYQHEVIGYNYRLSNISACIGRGQMKVLEKYLKHHKVIHDLYSEIFFELNNTKRSEIKVHSNPASIFDSNYWLTTITFEREVDVEIIRQHMWKAGIETRHLWKPMHLQPIYKDSPNFVNGVSESLFQRGLCLPSGPHVTEEDVRFVCDTMWKILETL